MKKIIIGLLLLFIPYLVKAQTKVINSKLKVTVVEQGSKADSLIVQGSDMVFKYLKTSDLLIGIAPSSGSANYIQNQNTADQIANLRINGAGKFGSTLDTGGDITITTGNPKIVFYDTNELLEENIIYNGSSESFEFSADISTNNLYLQGNASRVTGIDLVTLDTDAANKLYVDGKSAIISDGSSPSLNTGISATEIRTLIGAGTGDGTSDLVIGTTSTTAKAGNITTITTQQANDITANNNKQGVDNTVIRTTGNQSKSGEMTFTDAATFASSVSATDGLFSGLIESTNTSGTPFRARFNSTFFTDYTTNSVSFNGTNQTFSLIQNGVNRFKIESDGAATFASSVEAETLDLISIPTGGSGAILNIGLDINTPTRAEIGIENFNGVFSLYDSGSREDVKITTSGDSWFNGGKVGIGTVSPVTALEVYHATDNIKATLSGASGDYNFLAYKQGVSDKWLTGLDNSGNFLIRDEVLGQNVVTISQSNQSATFTSTLLATNGIFSSAATATNFIGSTQNTSIGNTSFDGSDTGVFKIYGGGTASASRGAVIQLFGNENSTSGRNLYLAAGTGGVIDVASAATFASTLGTADDITITAPRPKLVFYDTSENLEASIEFDGSGNIFDFSDDLYVRGDIFLAGNSGRITGINVVTNQNDAANKAYVDSAIAATGYKIYTASVEFSGTNTPIATVLENSLGGVVVWGRRGAGQWDATLVGAFTSSKTICFASNHTASTTTIKRSDSDSVDLERFNTSGVLIDTSAIISVEIRVYN